MKFFSVIVPVYNRPHEIQELLQSLQMQTLADFEVIIVEDGSENSCKEIVEQYKSYFDIRYFYKENEGQGFARNFGFNKANGQFFIVFDSDCIIPPHYLAVVYKALQHQKLDAYGGPDKAHPSFTPLQKAISYAMTSIFTTGGIRGNKKAIGVFHPRSFNMGISRGVYDRTKGYIITRMGEDIEFSLRIIQSGFKTGLIPKAYVYHKRRTNLKAFYRQLHFFGRARINIKRYFPDALKLVHAFPALFLLGLLSIPLLYSLNIHLGNALFGLYWLYFLAIFIDAGIQNKSWHIAALSVAAAFVQLSAYGIGFISEAFKGWKQPVSPHEK